MHASSPLQLVTKADAAAIFGVCIKSIDNYIKEGRLPQPVQFASKEYWHPEDFKAFLDTTFRRLTIREMEADVVAPQTLASDQRQRSGQGTSIRAPDAKVGNPVVRQRARQTALVKRLNSGT